MCNSVTSGWNLK